ncbi:extensin family protein [Ancylobacter sonchi]|uniref:extensin-like domain-containing protein n=1 Tax=Ancylobacter sonchi TaxID=1937790 RepID=UPI001BD4379E|nr:extensin family protein [Ancylobacter sonchi]MBS7533062.1 extensin family protein [Ancylobacter sonchi]
MTRGVSWFIVAPLVLLGLSACKFSPFERREPWRSEAEERCLAEGLVKPSATIVPMAPINGAGTCGMDHPFRISGLNQGSVEVAPKATLACPMTASLDRWVAEDIQPAAYAWFGQPVAKIKQMSSYSCRNMNGAATGKVSEHAFGNGFDVGGFVLADGREILVKTGWKGRPDERGFLRTVQATACQRFTVVLAPGSNIYHYDHIHVDLMRSASGRTTCKPMPVLPTPPNLPVYKAPPMVAAPPQATPAYYPPPAAAPGSESEPEEMDAPVGEPMVLSPPPAAPQPPASYPKPTYASPSYPSPGAPQPLAQPGYPAPIQPYGAPAAQAYPAQTYPAQGYPTQVAPASGYPAPAPAAQPPRPNGVPLPPAGIPMVMRWFGIDPATTGSITPTKRAYAAERHIATPIPPPPAVSGED